MYASELMEAIRKNPKKYEGKQYKVVEGHAEHNGTPYTVIEVYRDHNTENGMTLIGVDGGERTSRLVSVYTRTKLEEIKQPVTWQEAIQAWINKKTIYSYGQYGKHVYRSECAYLRDNENDIPISREELLRQQWYIED